MPMKAVTIRRWEVSVAFFLLMGSMVVMGILLKMDVDRNTTILQTKASIVQLQKGECVLRNFLHSSAGVRERLAASDPTQQARHKDLKAAHTANKLAHGLANDLCPN